MKTSVILLAVTLCYLTVNAQSSDKKSVVIGKFTTKDNALLILNPPNADQGVILPQLSGSQRKSLKPSSPSENGLTVFDTDQKAYYYWSDGAWVRMHAGNAESFGAIDPLDFRLLRVPDRVDRNNLLIFESENTFVTVSTSTDGEQLIAPVSLPHGATVREVTLRYMDHDQRELRVRLIRKSHNGNSSHNLIDWQSGGSSANIRQQTFTSFSGGEKIDLANYSYRILVAFDLDENQTVTQPSQATQRIYGITIRYAL